MQTFPIKAAQCAAGLAVVALTVAACGSSSSGGGTTPPSSSPTSQPSATPAAAATAPADEAAARAEITKNWTTFFNSNTPNTKSKMLLENGTNLGPALRKAVQEDKATGGTRSANVKKITFTSPTQANVTYGLHAAGRILNASGIAVLQGGTWKVSDVTFCTLVVLGNNERPVKGCPS
jgi:hypothetical protein